MVNSVKYILFFVILCIAVHNSQKAFSAEDLLKGYESIGYDINDTFMIKTSEDGEPFVIDFYQFLIMKFNRINFMNVGYDVVDDKVDPVPTPPALPTELSHKDEVEKINKYLSSEVLEYLDNTLSSYNTRYYKSETGVEAAEWIYYELLGYETSRDDVTINFFNNTFSAQPSIIARIEGTKSSDVVILGSHLDSITLSLNPSSSRSPGADDDGTGVVTGLQVFQALMNNNFKPERTVEIHFYAAEEAGLLGSKAVAKKYADDNVNVVGMMQIDMSGYDLNGPIGIVQDYTSADLNTFVELCLEGYSDLEYISTTCGYACSDHASWTENGYRSSFPFETAMGKDNPFIHTSQDTTSRISFKKVLEVSKFACGFVVELSYE
eukprot:TRINITY_DN322_c0_g1_i1.p1 TRINITY_DN322_c0_g1~~TRINITY_DN322_c0_g1_i1.p1  ORF type:complete len:379 (+),score=134.82 TRINITY_DN322_c0_g1_i1:110-1246(+)